MDLTLQQILEERNALYAALAQAQTELKQLQADNEHLQAALAKPPIIMQGDPEPAA